MTKQDRLSPEQHGFAASMDTAPWAWEYLWRNADYRDDWRWFKQSWSALEAEYGAPPQRDFFRWKQDPRAYRADDDEPLLGEC